MTIYSKAIHWKAIWLKVTRCFVTIGISLSIVFGSLWEGQLAQAQVAQAQVTQAQVTQIQVAQAQVLDRAPVVIDGYELFQITESGGLDAQERADAINLQLRDVVTTSEPPAFAVVERNNSPTILLNDRHLLTVTNRDVAPGKTRTEQANLWAQQLEESVDQSQQQRSAAYLQRSSLWAIVIVTVTWLIHRALGRFWRNRLQPQFRAVTQLPEPGTPSQINSPDLLLNLILLTIRSGLWIAAGFYVTNLFPWSRQWGYRFVDILISSLISPLFTLGDREYSLTSLFILSAFLIGLEILTKTIVNLLRSRVLQLAGISRGSREAVAILIRYGLLLIGALVIFQAWGIDISSLAILLSALGIGVGLGLQDIAKDFGSGLVLIFERPIQVGDFVQVGEFLGSIERIGARSTLIRTLDQISIIVPNSRFLSSEVINWSHDNPISRLHLPVGIAYGTDLDMVRSTLLDIAKEHPKVLRAPAPIVILRGFGDNAIDIELLVWTAEPDKQLVLKSELFFKIAAQFRHHHIEIPFPQRDLHLHPTPHLEELLQQWQNGRTPPP